MFGKILRSGPHPLKYANRDHPHERSAQGRIFVAPIATSAKTLPLVGDGVARNPEDPGGESEKDDQDEWKETADWQWKFELD